jgi:hypothetical protein
MAAELNRPTVRQRNGLRPEIRDVGERLAVRLPADRAMAEKAPIGLPWTAKREAPQRQAQSWFTMASSVAPS